MGNAVWRLPPERMPLRETFHPRVVMGMDPTVSFRWQTRQLTLISMGNAVWRLPPGRMPLRETFQLRVLMDMKPHCSISMANSSIDIDFHGQRRLATATWTQASS